MKAAPIAALILCIPLAAQAINTGKHILGNSKDDTSQPYRVPTGKPYVLKWSVSFKDKQAKHNFISVQIVDANSGKTIATTGTEDKDGQIEVPDGGDHKAKVIVTNGNYQVWWAEKTDAK